MAIPNETILTRPLGSSTAASEPEHYERKAEIDAIRTSVVPLIGVSVGTSPNSGTTELLAVSKDISTLFESTDYQGVLQFSIFGSFAANENTKTVTFGIDDGDIVLTNSGNGASSFCIMGEAIVNPTSTRTSGVFVEGTNASVFSHSDSFGTANDLALWSVRIQGEENADVVFHAYSLKFFKVRA